MYKISDSDFDDSDNESPFYMYIGNIPNYPNISEKTIKISFDGRSTIPQKINVNLEQYKFSDHKVIPINEHEINLTNELKSYTFSYKYPSAAEISVNNYLVFRFGTIGSIEGSIFIDNVFAYLID
tara:strand:+ start:476 stop:850 length:375 start_codon:yes stop_codon:yes gene_type:complete